MARGQNEKIPEIGESVMKIGFIGYGEAAYELSTGLKTEGLDHFYAYDVLLQNEKLAGPMKEKAARTGVELTSNVSEVIAKSDIVIAAVPANKTLEVAQSVLGSLKKIKYMWMCRHQLQILKNKWQTKLKSKKLYL